MSYDGKVVIVTGAGRGIGKAIAHAYVSDVLTHALAASFAPDHIRVNCISPGRIETGDYAMLRNSDHDQHLSGRVVKPEDITKACVYVTADSNDFLNATNIIIDGGMTRKMIYET